MFYISRSFRRRYFRPRPLIFLMSFLFILDAIYNTHTCPPPTRVTLAAAPPTQKIFIASMFRNTEYILRLSYTNSLLQLISDLGPSNVFVSIMESGSFDDTKGALLDLQSDLERMSVAHRILTGINHDEQLDMLRSLPEAGQRKGWVYTGRPESKAGFDGWEMRRIPYLAAERNRVMEPLFQDTNHHYDKVLWINDVVFTTEDVLTLLDTNHGSYAAACALDFHSSPTSYYDTFALRDIYGYKTATQSYPYFHSSPSLHALRSMSPVPVKSCWNGMMVFESRPFYGAKPLKFRGISDSLASWHVEGSECCLIHADNPLSEKLGVWLNPNVRVSYSIPNYDRINPSSHSWPSNWGVIAGIWGNRLARWIGRLTLWSENAVIRRRVNKWVKGGRKGEHEGGMREVEMNEMRKEPGVECLVNEMQILYDNGWGHV
ncbi:cryptococcal mannosyltransferase 1-domain-containing protein [Bisporella sp. PMI_857]|nr:cryptococcal mannosyltransferase 1-domain-containing protein [Bisporella sp. PMI_857]